MTDKNITSSKEFDAAFNKVVDSADELLEIVSRHIHR